MIVGVSEAAPDVSFGKMMERQQALAAVLLADPDVATSRRRSAPTARTPPRTSAGFASRCARSRSAARRPPRSSRGSRTALAEVPGISLYLQPVQDLQVDARVSRTQYQYTIEDADPDELAAWAPRLLEAMRALPELRDVASDQQAAGARAPPRDRSRQRGARLGVTAQALDDTLYDAFGQRIVSTTFTQLNQYRVILEVRPEDRDAPDALDKLYVRVATGDAGAAVAFARFEHRDGAARDRAPGPVPVGDAVVQHGAGRLARRRGRGDRARRARGSSRRPRCAREFTGAAQAFRESLASSRS